MFMYMYECVSFHLILFYFNFILNKTKTAHHGSRVIFHFHANFNVGCGINGGGDEDRGKLFFCLW